MPLRNNNFSSAMQIVLVFALTVLLILLSVFNAVSSTTTVSLTNTNHLHNRRSLHQPFFPSTIVADPVHPPSPSPQPQPTRPLYKHPTTTTTTSSDPTTTTASPFFPVYQAPPPPSPPPPPPPSPSSDNNYAALPTFPANISSLVVPNSHHSSPSSSHSPPSLKLIIISVILCLLAVVLLISLALLHRRHRHRYRDGPFKPTNEIDSPPSDDVRLYPSDSASSDIHPLPPNPKPFRPNTSAEFLYLGTIASTHSREFEHTNVDTHLESPEIRPLPPLPRKGHHLSGHQANPYPDTDTSGGEEGNQRVVRHYQSNDDEEDAVESFYSPVGSPDRLRRLSSTSSRRAIEVLERDIYLENQNCSSYSPISTSSSLSNSKQWEPSSIPVNLNSHTSNPSSPGGMSTPSPMEVRLPTLRHPINHSREFGGNGKESGLSKLFKEEIERPATTTDTDYSKAKEQVLPPQPPPPPPPPVFVRTESKPGPPPLPRPWRSFSSGEQERVRSGEVSKPKLKPLHWDNFWTSSDRAMVWDQLKSGSFQFNEELIEKLFGVNGPTAKRLNMYSSDQEYRVLDPKKSPRIFLLF